jgi:hypothetical protein
MKQLALTMLCLTASAFPASAKRLVEVQRVEVISHFICAGICVDQRIVVFANGNIWWQIGPLRRAFVTRRHFLVSSSAVAQFIREMDAIRPPDNLSDPVGCDAELHTRNRWDWKIKWSGKGSPTELLSCDGDKRVWGAWRSALDAIGMPDGLYGEIKDTVKELPVE